MDSKPFPKKNKNNIVITETPEFFFAEEDNIYLDFFPSSHIRTMSFFFFSPSSWLNLYKI